MASLGLRFDYVESVILPDVTLSFVHEYSWSCRVCCFCLVVGSLHVVIQ